MPASLAAAKAGVTTGEWAAALRKVYGEYRGPTGVALVIETGGEDIEAVKRDVAALSEKLGRQLTFLVGKPGLDGHSNGAEQIAARARAVGMDAIYEGIRLTPAEIVAAAKEKRAHAVGLSILSGSHLDLVQDVVRLMRAEGLDNVPLVVGGIIPPADALALKQMGVAGVYTPKDFKITGIMGDVVKLVAATHVNPREIDLATIRTWPAADHRSSATAGSISPPAASPGASTPCGRSIGPATTLDAAITDVEAWYAARELPPRFKLTDGAFAPDDLPHASGAARLRSQ